MPDQNAYQYYRLMYQHRFAEYGGIPKGMHPYSAIATRIERPSITAPEPGQMLRNHCNDRTGNTRTPSNNTRVARQSSSL